MPINPDECYTSSLSDAVRHIVPKPKPLMTHGPCPNCKAPLMKEIYTSIKKDEKGKLYSENLERTSCLSKKCRFFKDEIIENTRGEVDLRTATSEEEKIISNQMLPIELQCPTCGYRKRPQMKECGKCQDQRDAMNTISSKLTRKLPSPHEDDMLSEIQEIMHRVTHTQFRRWPQGLKEAWDCLQTEIESELEKKTAE